MPPIRPQAGLNPAGLPMAMGENWGVLLPPHPTSMPRGLLSWDGDRQMGSTQGSEQRFQAAPGLYPSMYASRSVHAYTHTHPPSFVHIYTHLSLKKCTLSLIPRTHRQNILEEVPSAQASRWPSGPIWQQAYLL